MSNTQTVQSSLNGWTDVRCKDKQNNKIKFKKKKTQTDNFINENEKY